MADSRVFTVGELAARVGVATSALRFYEEHGLIVSERTKSGHRRYSGDALRRVSFIKVAQNVGMTLTEIADALASLPDNRTPTKTDWAKIAKRWQPILDRADRHTRVAPRSALELYRLRMPLTQFVQAVQPVRRRRRIGHRTPVFAWRLRRRRT